MNVQEYHQLVAAVSVGIFIALCVLAAVISSMYQGWAFERYLCKFMQYYEDASEEIILTVYTQAVIKADELCCDPYGSEKDDVEVGALIESLQAVALKRGITLPTDDEIFDKD